MVDAVGAEIKRLADIGGRTFFTGMDDNPESPGAALTKEIREFRRGMAKFRPAQTDRDDLRCPGHHLVQKLERGFLGPVALRDDHERGTDAKLPRRIREGALYSAHHDTDI